MKIQLPADDSLLCLRVNMQGPQLIQVILRLRGLAL